MDKRKKIIGLIPARLGSMRVKAKNLRLIDGKPLIYYTIEAVKKAKLFNEVYVNSESDLFGLVAKRYGINFYKRPAELATSSSMIDEYIYEFLTKIECDVLAVVNPTSPFLSHESIDGAIENFLLNNFDTQLACENIRTHCFLNGSAVNFSTDGQHPRSQDIPPIKALNFAVTVWNAKSFMKQFEQKGHAVYTGRLGFYSFNGLEAIDIDWEEDFVLAELIMQNRNKFENPSPQWDEVLQEIIGNNVNIQT